MTIPYLTLGKWVAGILAGLGIAWAIYAGIIRPTTKPNPTTKQEATTIVNYNMSTPRQSFGCTFIKIQRIPDEICNNADINAN